MKTQKNYLSKLTLAALFLALAYVMPFLTGQIPEENGMKPSARTYTDKYVPFLPLLAELDKRLETGTVKVAIEGGSASGKTTLSQLLAELYDCTVFHMEAFLILGTEIIK